MTTKRNLPKEDREYRRGWDDYAAGKPRKTKASEHYQRGFSDAYLWLPGNDGISAPAPVPTFADIMADASLIWR